MASELASLQPARSCLHRSRRLNCRHVRMTKGNTKEMNGGDGGGGKMNREIRKQMNGELEKFKTSDFSDFLISTILFGFGVSLLSFCSGLGFFKTLLHLSLFPVQFSIW